MRFLFYILHTHIARIPSVYVLINNKRLQTFASLTVFNFLKPTILQSAGTPASGVQFWYDALSRMPGVIIMIRMRTRRRTNYMQIKHNRPYRRHSCNAYLWPIARESPAARWTRSVFCELNVSPFTPNGRRIQFIRSKRGANVFCNNIFRHNICTYVCLNEKRPLNCQRNKRRQSREQPAVKSLPDSRCHNCGRYGF